MRDEVTLTLNQRTVEEAIQAYLDLHITPKMKLKSFKAQYNGTGYNQSADYICTLEEIKQESAA